MQQFRRYRRGRTGGETVVAWLKPQDPALSTEDALNGLGHWILDLDHPREAIPISATPIVA